MLGFIGRWAQSKGMKIIPNWIGTNKDSMPAVIVSEGFSAGTATAVPSSDPADAPKNNNVISTTPPATTLSDYETTVDYSFQQFSFTPFSVFGFSPFGVFSFSPFGVFSFSPFAVFSFSPATFFFTFVPFYPFKGI
jgi:hypothetical protein